MTLLKEVLLNLSIYSIKNFQVNIYLCILVGLQRKFDLFLLEVI